MDHGFINLLGTLVAIIVATQLFGIIAQRFGQPSVLGELVAGIVMGGSVLNVIDPAEPVLAAFAEIGILVLLFAIGLETDLRRLLRVGPAAITVGTVGVILPFALGYGVAAGLGLSVVTAVVCGAALTATSIGISARVLSDLGRLNSEEGQIVLGAAVFDDVIGLIILSVVSSVVSGAAMTFAGISVTTAIAVGFIVFAILVGSRTIPPVFRYIESLDVAGTLGALGLGFAFLMAWLAASAGSAMIIGAFAAGLVLHNTPQRERIEKATTSIGHLFVPIFFASVGARVDLSSLGDTFAVKIGAGLLVVAIIGKFVAGFAPFWFRGQKTLIGIAMIPRGEVGLIFAQMGLATGALDTRLFSAVTIMVMGTTFLAPPLLNRYVRKLSTDEEGNRRGSGGVDDLVAGSEH